MALFWSMRKVVLLLYQYLIIRGVLIIMWPPTGSNFIESGQTQAPGVTTPATFTESAVLNNYTQFRYVIIPGGVPAGRAAAVDYSDYEAVKRYYNLPD